MKDWLVDDLILVLGLPALMLVTGIVSWLPRSACNNNPELVFIIGVIGSIYAGIVTFRNLKERFKRVG